MRWILVATLLASSAFAGEVAPPPKYPVEAFGELPLIEDAEISPDGTMIAAKMAVAGAQRLLIRSLVDPAATPVSFALGSLDMSWFSWANSDRLLVSIGATDNFLGDPVRVTRLVSVSKQGGEPVKLDWEAGAQIGDDIVWRPRGGGPFILLSTRTTVFSDAEGFWPRVDQVDVASGKAKHVLRGRDGINEWFADTNGTVRFGFGYNSDVNRASLIYRAADNQSFRTLDRASLSKGETLLSPVAFQTDPNKIIVRSSHEGRDGFYDYDVQRGEYGKALFLNDRYDAGGISLSLDGQSIAGVHYVDDRPRVEWFDPEMKQLQADLDKSVPGRVANIVSKSADWNRLLVTVSSPTVPPSWWIMDRSTGKMSKIGHSQPALVGAVLAPMAAVSYKARDGLDIPAYLTLPVGRAPKNLPLIVLPHGGPWVRDSLNYDHWVQFLANRGYAVLQPNYRGSSGYGAAFSDKGDGQWGLAMQDDVTDGVKWAVAQGTADPKRVCIMGGSYGGYAALQGSVRDPDLYRCAVSFAGVSDLAMQTRYYANFLYGAKFRGEMKRAVVDYEAVSPVKHAADIKVPILLVHGKKDLTVPYEQSAKMYKALLASGKTVEFVTQPLGDHHLSRQADRIELLQRVEAFLARYNPAS